MAKATIISSLFLFLASTSVSANDWQEPQKISDRISFGDYLVERTQVATNSTGDAVVVWSQKVDYKDTMRVFMREYRDGVWKSPNGLDDAISPPSQAGACSGWRDCLPNVAMNDRGEVIIVWLDSGKLYMSLYRGGTWIHPKDVNDHAPIPFGVQYTPNIAMDNQGNIVLGWVGDPGRDKDVAVFTSEYRQGQWKHPAKEEDKISPNFEEEQYRTISTPKVAIDNSGRALMVWKQGGENGPLAIYKSHYDGNKWVKPIDMDDSFFPRAGGRGWDFAADKNGNAIVVWQYDNGGYTSEYRNGVWSKPIALGGVNPKDRSIGMGYGASRLL
jgi:hypothetical protein